MAIGEPPQTWSTTSNGGQFQFTTVPSNYSDISYVNIPADLSWMPNYRNEVKLNELTKTMGSIIALTEWLDDHPNEPLTTKKKKVLLEHLNNLLLLTTKDFMTESQKPKAPEMLTRTITATHSHMINTANPLGGISVQTHAQAQTQADQESSGEEE